MKKQTITKSLILMLSFTMLLSLLFAGCGAKEENTADLTGSNWVYVDGEDQGSITFAEDEVTAVFVFEGQENASMIQGPYTATGSSFTVDDPNTGNKVEFTYSIDGDTLTISQIAGTAVNYQYNRK